MSVIIYPDKKTAARAVCALIVAQLIEKPSSILGFDYDPTLLPVFAELAETTASGLLDWSRTTVFQLCERVKSEDALSLRDLLWRSILHRTNLSPKSFYAPPEESDDWGSECLRLDERILHRGGMNQCLLALKDDGAILFNRPAVALAHGSHTTQYKSDRVITAGITTVMQAKKLVVLATGEDKATVVYEMLRDAVSPQCPASCLQLHADATFILDAAAAGNL